jgi:outer membrane protein
MKVIARYVKLLLPGVLVCASPVSGAAGLLDVYRDALASDAQFAAAKSSYVAAEQRVPQSRAALLPSLSVSGNSLWNDNTSNTGIGAGEYESYEYSANLTQPIYRREAWIANDQSKQALRQASAELDLARQDLILRVAQAYFDVLLAQDNLATVKAQRAAYAEQAASANRKMELGTGNITDVRDTQARAKLSVAQEIAAQVDLEAKREALRVLTNNDPGTLEPLRREVRFAGPAEANAATVAQQARTQAKSVLAGEAAVDVALKEAQKVRSGHYPTVDLVASYGESDSATTSEVGTQLEGSTIGVQVNVPIFTGGSVMYREREARALLDKAKSELEGARRDSAFQAQQAYLSATAGFAQIQALEDALKSATEALAANKRGLEIGVRVDIDVLNAQQQVSETERDLARARYDTLMALLKLRKAMGTLVEDDLQKLAAYFGN